MKVIKVIDVMAMPCSCVDGHDYLLVMILRMKWMDIASCYESVDMF